MKSNDRFRPPPTYPPTYPPYPRGGGGGPRGGRGRNMEGPYNNMPSGYNQRRGTVYNRNRGGGFRGNGGSGGGLGGSGHMLMVDPDLPDPLDDHWQRMQRQKAWEVMNKNMGGGPGRGPTYPPFANPGQWRGSRPFPTGPTYPPWPNMDRRRAMGGRQQPQDGGRARIWSGDGSGRVDSGSGRTWKDRWPTETISNVSTQTNVSVNNPTNVTDNIAPNLSEFQRRGNAKLEGGTVPRPPSTHLHGNGPFQPPQRPPSYNPDQWRHRTQDAWNRRSYPPFYDRPDSPREAKLEWEAERSKGQTHWPNQQKTLSFDPRSGARFPDGNQGNQETGQPKFRLSDLSSSLATIVKNMTGGTQLQNQTFASGGGRFPPNQNSQYPTEMTHTFPPNQENPVTRDRYTDLQGRGIPRQGGQLGQTENIQEGEVLPPNVAMRPFTTGGSQRRFIGGSQTSKAFCAIFCSKFRVYSMCTLY